MGWGTETNLTPGAPSASHQTSIGTPGFVEDTWGTTHYPCVRAEFEFENPYAVAGGEGNVYLRYAGVNTWIRAQVKYRSNDKIDFSIKQNFGTDLSQDPDYPIVPWTQVVGTVYAIEEDGSGGWYVGGDFTDVIDEFGTTQSAFGSVIHINSDGSFDSTFEVTPNGSVHAIKKVGTSVVIGGTFTQIDTGANHGGPYNETRLAWVSGTTGAPVDVGFTVDNGYVEALEYVSPYIYFGGTFTQVDSVSKKYIARVDISGTPTHDPTWDASLDARVHAIKDDGTGLWIAGRFTNRGKALCKISYPASVTMVDAQLLSGGYTGRGYALDYDSGTDTLYVAGRFDEAGTTSGILDRTVACSFQGGALGSWAPDIDGPEGRSISLAGDNVMVGGDFTLVNSETRIGIAELDAETAELQSWDPNISGTLSDVYAIGWDTSNFVRLIGGYFSSSQGISRSDLASYKAVPPTGIATILEKLDFSLPASKKVTVMMDITCGEILRTWLMDGDSGGLLVYKEQMVEWGDEYTARVEVGPAGKQGPQLNSASLASGALTCDKPVADPYTACAGPTSITHFVLAADHMAESYPGTTGDTTYTVPRGWNKGVVGLNPPYQRPARWWHELIQPGESINGGNTFLNGLTLEGDVTVEAYQFSNAWCLGIVDIRGHPSGYLNLDDDPVSARWSNVLIAGNAVATGDTVLIDGLSVRIDYKKSAIAVGWSSGCGVKKNGAERSYKGTKPTERDTIYEGTFVPSFIDWSPVSNLDQWTNGISLAIDMDCSNVLTVDVWGINESMVSAKIFSDTVTLDPLNVDPAGLDTNLLGTYWGVFSFMEGVNLALLDDELNSKIEWNELTADLGAACGA